MEREDLENIKQRIRKLSKKHNLSLVILLDDLNILPKDFAEEISKSAGLRNIIVHEYNSLDKAIIYKKVGDAINQYVKYCDYIIKFLK